MIKLKWRETFVTRFWRRVDKSGDCWLWTGGIAANGYGKLSREYKKLYAHRVAHELINGPIPDWMHVCHRCDNPKCVNPTHLFLGTRSDNMQDCLKKGRMTNNKPKTHCKRGHVLAGENRLITSSRACRICRDLYIKNWRFQKAVIHGLG